jgi:glyoxylase-like metal-dependent hydrolase (beta-lactamase superfamily II)
VQLAAFESKLHALERLLVRGYDVDASAPFQDRVSRPTSVPHLWQISPHLYKLRGPSYFPNFALIVSDAGRGLLVDAGLIDEKLLDRTIELARERLGLRGIDAVVVSHMHGDHFLSAPHLRERWGVQVWALDRMADKMQAPERFDYAASVESYGAGFDRVKVDRVLRSGEVIAWQGFQLTVDWMPGQTEFAMCLHGTIDGKRIAFTGDHIFADPDNPAHDGHEAVVARNSGILDEGYIVGADYLARLAPDMLVGGHSYVMDRPAALIQRYGHWARQMRAAFQTLSSEPDYRLWFDPFWVRAEPYRVSLARGRDVSVQIHVRNFRDRVQTHRIVVHTPPGISARPRVLEGTVAAGQRQTFPIELRADASARDGVGIVALDVTLDGQRRGELFDLVFDVER